MIPRTLTRWPSLIRFKRLPRDFNVNVLFVRELIKYKKTKIDRRDLRGRKYRMSIASARTDDIESAVIGKVTRRLFPFMIILTMVNFLDRVNIGYAALTMNKDLGLDPAIFGFAAGVFFLG